MKDFERIIPEQAGVSSKAILRLLDELESGSTEPHGTDHAAWQDLC